MRKNRLLSHFRCKGREYSSKGHSGRFVRQKQVAVAKIHGVARNTRGRLMQVYLDGGIPALQGKPSIVCGLRGLTLRVFYTGRPCGCNLVSVITNRGGLNFMVFKERFDIKLPWEFPRLLLSQNSRKVYFIIACQPVHRAKKVQNWPG